jgi:hypothetical protein
MRRFYDDEGMNFAVLISLGFARRAEPARRGRVRLPGDDLLAVSCGQPPR